MDSMRHFTQKEENYTYKCPGTDFYDMLYLSLIGENTQEYLHRS
jgi:hypothetical protein